MRPGGRGPDTALGLRAIRPPDDLGSGEGSCDVVSSPNSEAAPPARPRRRHVVGLTMPEGRPTPSLRGVEAELGRRLRCCPWSSVSLATRLATSRQVDWKTRNLLLSGVCGLHAGTTTSGGKPTRTAGAPRAPRSGSGAAASNAATVIPTADDGTGNRPITRSVLSVPGCPPTSVWIPRASALVYRCRPAWMPFWLPTVDPPAAAPTTLHGDHELRCGASTCAGSGAGGRQAVDGFLLGRRLRCRPRSFARLDRAWLHAPALWNVVGDACLVVGCCSPA